MKREWDVPAIQNVAIADTALSDQPDRPGDGVYLGWLGQEGTDCNTCS